MIEPRHGVQEFDSTGKGERRRDRDRRGTAHGEQRWLCFPGGLSRTESLQRGLNGSVERLDLCIETIDVGELPRQSLPMVVVDKARQGLLEHGHLRSHASFRQCSHRGGLGSSGHERLQHGPSRDAHHSGNH